MADKKISALTGASTPLAGTEVLPIVQSGSTVKVSVDNLTAGRDMSAGNVTTTKNIIFGASYAGGSFATDYLDGRYLTSRIFNVPSGSSFVFAYAGGDGVTFSSAGDITPNIGNFKPIAGKGIDFSANTHAAGMTSELLNDYEEGTWTGGISFGGGSTGITYANRVGYYTRIGNIVTVSCYLVLSNKGSSTGTARITGLPFTCVNNASGYSALSVLPLNVTFTGQLSGYANVNDTTIDLVPSTGVNLTDVGFANNSTFIISLTYRAA